MSLLGLSSELLLLIASFVRQVDLLNVSLVCKQLHFAIEPELYREYSNSRLYARSILPFIRKMIERPDLAKYVHQVDLHGWDSFDTFFPLEYNGKSGLEPDVYRQEELTQRDYHVLTQAARLAGVIDTIDAYEPSSRLLAKVESMSKDMTIHNSPDWYEHFLDDTLHFDEVSYDAKFCQLLRTGVEDPQVVLLFALLPNLHKIFLRGGPHDMKALEWRVPHKFASLRELIVCGDLGGPPWPLGFYSSLLSTTTRLEDFRVCFASSYYQDISDDIAEPSKLVPLTLDLGSLSRLTKLELKSCCFTTEDLRCLVRACPGIKSFYYYNGDDEQDSYGPSPAEMIRILEPLKDSLQELYLELDTSDVETNVDYRIGSLVHFTSLKTLDTSAEMWEMLEDLDLLDPYRTEDVPDNDSRLCFRLPKSLEQLIFHLSVDQAEPSVDQIVDILLMRADVLPNLNLMYINTDDEGFLSELRDAMHENPAMRMMAEDPNYMPKPINVDAGSDVFLTVFDSVEASHNLPDTRWFGNKYSIRYRKPNKTDRALFMRGQAVEAGRIGVDITNTLEHKLELDALLRENNSKVDGPTLYYETDEEVTELYMGSIGGTD